MTATLDDEVADPRRANAELRRRLDEALAERDESEAQKAAMAELLEVINGSVGNLAPVFEAILEKAMRLCEAAFGLLSTYDGEQFHSVAQHGVPEEFVQRHLREPFRTAPNTTHDRLIRGEHLVHVTDLAAEGIDDPRRRAVVEVMGARTILGVALRKDGSLLGAIHIYRKEVHPFSDKQIALLQNFAAQAVIAMENARLITETRQALEQQTATAEVLGVINSSPGNLGPVFEAMLEKAMRLCEAAFGTLRTYDGDNFRAVATHGVPEPFVEFYAHNPHSYGPGTGPARLLSGEPFVHVADLASEEAYLEGEPNRRALVDLGGARTALTVPLRKHDALLGFIMIYRQEVRPFSDKQIALLQNFAAQAVIAIENARLITETREALEQQTATAEVLQVINSSPGDLAPVFDAMLEKVMRLCEASFGIANTYDGDRFHTAALHGVPEPLAELWLSAAPPPAANSPLARIASGEDVVHIEDFAASPGYLAGEPRPRAMVELGGAHSYVAVALRKDGKLLGTLAAYRQEVHLFTDKQIALLQNLAAQAVIAMENARLITETREALEHQTATAEVLQVINSSPGDLAPVFDAILEKAHTLCSATQGALVLFDGERFHASATRGLGAFAEVLRGAFRPSPGSPQDKLLRGEPLVHIPDAGETNHPTAQRAFELAGIRTVLYVALRKDSALLGYIAASRTEVRPFTDKQIALLQNFAAQAVIAMENARLITETREALDQQTATAEVLQVINSSPGDLAPVFEAMLERAMRLCGAEFGEFFITEGEQFRAIAVRGVPATFADFRHRNPAPPIPGSITARILTGEPVIHVADVKDDDLYRRGDLHRRALVDLGGARTFLSVTLIKDRAVLGSINVYRQEVRPFSDNHIALLQSFAAQAVIAMENARLITETHEALEQQTATADVLQVINASPGNLTPVFDVMLEKATVLCGAAHGNLWTYDGERFHPVATHGSPGFAQWLSQSGAVSPPPGSLFERMVRGERFVQIADAANDNPYLTSSWSREVVEITGARTVLVVPLRKDRALLGAIFSYRQEVRPFADKEIALLENFAAQAVIAMENARLITETREALEQQTATAEVLGVINSSPGDLAPVFDAMLKKAMHLCEASFGGLWTFNGDRYVSNALRGVPAAYAAFLAENTMIPGPGSAPYRFLHGERSALQNIDLADEENYRRGDPQRLALVDLGGARTALQVPLCNDETVFGVITIYRNEVRPFSERQVALLQNFAAQAVIAMENARLITETREALEQQQAIAEILQVINQSPNDLQPVFDTLLDKAMRLCEAAFGVLAVKEGEQTRFVASQGLPPALSEWRRNHPVIDIQNTLLTRILAGERYIHTPDLKDDDLYRHGEPLRRANVDLGGARTSLYVPLTRDRDVLGTIHIYRQEVRPFTDKQIALLQNFAAHAVIAMENARLLDEIRQRQAELRVTFDNMADGVVMFDEELRLTAWNRNFQELLDLPDAVLTERPSYTDYLRILAERGEFGKENVEAELNRRLENTNEEFRAERTRPDGRVIEVRRNAVPDGGFVLIYSDITERKRSEAEIRAARDAAEAAYRDLKAAQANLIQAEKMASLGQLTAGIAHEIKNPLNFVNNFAGLSVELLDELKETTAPAVAALGEDRRAEVDETIGMLTGNLEKIAEHGRRADGIVKSMLEHSRGSSGERRSVDLNGLIEEALSLAYHGARAQDASFNITLERDFGQGITPIELVPQDITRVCLNLIGNGFYAATKRQKEGSDPKFQPTLKVTTRDLGDAVEIRVRDNGVGIAPEIKDKLFQPFFTTKPTGEGTGLGLSISYDIVTQEHGGTIAVDSRVGEFTEFTVRLPRAYGARMAEAAS